MSISLHIWNDNSLTYLNKSLLYDYIHTLFIAMPLVLDLYHVVVNKLCGCLTYQQKDSFLY